MPTPTVTGFTAGGNLARGRTGLNSTNNSTSAATLTGENFADGMSVSVTNGGSVSWAGTLSEKDGAYTTSLTCTNTSSGEGDSEDVTVTVGSGNDTSPGYQTKVDVGT
jgi:hypothetical protein